MGDFQFPNYTANVPLMSNNTWKSDASFTYSLLSGVFKQAEKNLNSIFTDYQELKTCKINPDNLFDFEYCNIQNSTEVDVDLIIEDNIGPVVYGSVWLALGLLFTLIGIIWCICNKCCCCCKVHKDLDDLVNTDPAMPIRTLPGSGDLPKQGKNNLILQVVVGSLMVLWIIGFSFSVFISFASNEKIRKSIFELPEDIYRPLDDADAYRNTTKDQITSIFITSYGNLSDRIREITNETPQSNLKTSFEQINKLSVATSSLQSIIEAFENHVDDKLELQFGAINKELQSLNLTLADKVVGLYKGVESRFSDVTQLQSIRSAIEETGLQLAGNSRDMNLALDEVPIDQVRKNITEAEEDWLDIVGSSVYGTFMALNILILFMLIGIIVGSIVTWMGKGSARKTGFLFYRFTITAIFISGWIYLIVMLTQFAGAGYFANVACEAIKDLENNDTTDPSLTTNLFGTRQTSNNNTDYETPSYPHVVRSCKNGESAYNAFQLVQVYDVESIRNISENFRTSAVSKVKVQDDFFPKNVQNVHSSLQKHLIALQVLKNETENASDQDSFYTLDDITGFKDACSQVEYELIAVLNDVKNLATWNTRREAKLQDQTETVINLVNNYENFVYDQMKDKVGECEPLYLALNATRHVLCYKVLAPVATYWWALQFLMGIFVAIIITALVSERVFN